MLFRSPGGRRGARREMLENYIKRLAKLEEIANSFSGVDKSFAIQSGRELRIMVKPDENTFHRDPAAFRLEMLQICEDLPLVGPHQRDSKMFTVQHLPPARKRDRSRWGCGQFVF